MQTPLLEAGEYSFLNPLATRRTHAVASVCDLFLSTYHASPIIKIETEFAKTGLWNKTSYSAASFEINKPRLKKNVVQ
jgi:hypothetical protein